MKHRLVRRRGGDHGAASLGRGGGGSRAGATYGAHEEGDGDGLLCARHDVRVGRVGTWVSVGIN